MNEPGLEWCFIEDMVTAWVLRRGGVPPEMGMVWRGLNIYKLLGKEWSYDLRSCHGVWLWCKGT